MDENPIPIQAGEIVIFTQKPHYVMGTGTGDTKLDLLEHVEQLNFPPWPSNPNIAMPLHLDFGTAPFGVHTISGVFQMDHPAAQYFNRNLPAMIKIQTQNTRIHPWVEAFEDYLGTEIQNPKPGFQTIAARILDLLIAQTLRHWLLNTQHSNGWLRGLTDPVLSLTLQAMHHRPAHPWSVQELAELCGQSRAGFARRFKTVMDDTPLAYLTRWRMHIGSNLLRQSHLSIAQISYKTGYQSSFAFGRAFKAEFGQSPYQYRKSNQRVIQKTPPQPFAIPHDHRVQSW